MAKHIAKFRMSREALVDMLLLPKSTNIVKIFEDNNVLSGDFTFVIEHDDLPKTKVGKAIEEINPESFSELAYLKDGTPRWRISFDWGISDG